MSTNLTVSEYRVLHTPAGYYVGRLCFDPGMPEMGMNVPYDRLGAYFEEYAEAEGILRDLILNDISSSETFMEWDSAGVYFSVLDQGGDHGDATEAMLGNMYGYSEEEDVQAHCSEEACRAAEYVLDDDMPF